MFDRNRDRNDGAAYDVAGGILNVIPKGGGFDLADRNGTIKGLALLLVFLILTSVAIKMTGTNVRHNRYGEMIEAASRMEKCEEALKAELQELGRIVQSFRKQLEK